MPGPDFTNCGNPVDWGDRQSLHDLFPAAISAAVAAPAVDIELARWNGDDPLAAEYKRWWTSQLDAIRRELATTPHIGLKPVISRRVDKGDGFTKCYIRFDRSRPRVAAVAA